MIDLLFYCLAAIGIFILGFIVGVVVLIWIGVIAAGMDYEDN